MDDVLIVIVSETPRQLLVIHLWFILPESPAARHLVRVGQLDLPAVPGPGDEVLTAFVS